MRRRLPLVLVGVALGLLALAAASCGGEGADAQESSSLVVAGAWARETAGNPGENGAVYLTVVNAQEEADRLIGARVASDVARNAHLHTTVADGELLRMAAVPAWEVEAEGGTLTLAPGGHHVMLLELAAPLRAGDRFPLALVFEQAGEREVTVVVRSAAGE